jgi:hypothetical protein
MKKYAKIQMERRKERRKRFLALFNKPISRKRLRRRTYNFPKLKSYSDSDSSSDSDSDSDLDNEERKQLAEQILYYKNFCCKDVIGIIKQYMN